MRVMRIFGAVCACVVAFSTAAFAQQQPSAPCGSLQDAEGELTAYEKYFRDPRFAAFRKPGFRRLSASDTQEVIWDAETCQTVLRAALTLLRTFGSWPPTEERGYDFTVFRYGRYYAILMKPSDDPVAGPSPFDPFIVFRADGLQHLVTILA